MHEFYPDKIDGFDCVIKMKQLKGTTIRVVAYYKKKLDEKGTNAGAMLTYDEKSEVYQLDCSIKDKYTIPIDLEYFSEIKTEEEARKEMFKWMKTNRLYQLFNE